MKKKLLIVMLVALMACLFSVAASAANEVTLVDGTTADITTVFNVNSSNQITGFKSGYDKNSVTDVIFPDELEGIEANFLFNSSTTINTITFAATDTFFISGDNVFSGCSVKTITFNPECVVELRKGNFADCTSLTSITFPKFKKLAGSAFKGCANMVNTNELVFAEGMTSIGGHVFNGCTSVTGTVYFPSTLEKIEEYSFQKTTFTKFDLSLCSSLSAVGGGYGGPFTDNDKITELDLSACVSLKSLKNSFAQGCDNLVSVKLPPNLESIPHKAFAHCYKLQSLVFPASLTYVADEAFHSARSGQTVKTFTLYLQSYVEFHSTYPFRDSSAKIEYVLIGEGLNAEEFIAANTFSGITGATVVDYLDPASPYTYTAGGVLSAHTIVVNYCRALALEGEHSSNDNPCVINCSTCKMVKLKENPVHTEKVISITYGNGYGNAGITLVACSNEGCTHEASASAEALFVSLGYSAPEDGRGALTIGYLVNNDAISEYEFANGVSLKYGGFAVLKDRIGNNDVLNDKGEAIDGVVCAEISSHGVTAFELKIVGFETEEHRALQIVMGTFVGVCKGGVTEYTYLQDGEPDEGERYAYTTYNDNI